MTSADPPSLLRTDELWWRFLLAGGVLSAVYVALSGVGPLVERIGFVVAFCLVSGAAPVAIALGVRRHRPAHAGPWLWLLLGQAIYFVADGNMYIRTNLLGLVTYPSISACLYIAHYAGTIVGLVLLLRRRAPGRDRPALLDGAILGTAAATLMWVFVLSPQIDGFTGSLWQLVLLLTAPTLDLVILVVLLLLLVSTGLRSRSFYLLAGGLCMVLSADIIFYFQMRGGGYTTGDPVDLMWLASYLLIGAAALDPSMRSLATASPVGEQTASRLRLVSLAAASLAAPVTLIVQGMLGQTPDVAVCAAAASLMFLLVLARMGGLVSAQRQAAITDGLTGLHNRRFFEAQLQLELERAIRTEQSVGIVTMDIDRFKSVNDSYGHPGGDRVLVQVAEQIRSSARTGDVVARYGGEEFAVLMPGLGGSDLAAAAERLRLAISGTPMEVNDQVALAITVSAGAVSAPANGSTVEALVAVADQALYAAKRAGRNRLVTGDYDLSQPTHARTGAQAPVLQLLTSIADDIDSQLSVNEHSSAISRWAEAVAQELDLGPDAGVRCGIAGRLHDIGKLFLPPDLLAKPAALTDDEWQQMRTHPAQGARLAGLVTGFESIAEIIKQHHERYDGGGYPHQLRRQQIRIEARIIAVCDSFAAMCANRPYKNRLSAAAARSEILVGRGTQFDPDVADAFVSLLDSGLIADLALLPVLSHR
jgi:diguanylate cyclase (GGDEF)-like protein